MERADIREKVVILGAGGHAKVVAECIDAQKYDIVGILDKDTKMVGAYINGIPIIGSDESPELWLQNGITGCIIGIGHVGNYGLRKKLYEKYKNAGFHMIKAIHPGSLVSKNAIISDGTVVMPGTVINANAMIGNNVIINTGSVIEHDVVVHDGVHIAPGSIISGGSEIGENTLIGARSVVIQMKKIGKNTIIGAGTVVIKDIPDGVVAVGNPARIVREDK